MTYEDAIQFLFNSHTSVYKGLHRIRYVLGTLGNPQDAFPSVLITGTNGKGSTVKMVSSILKKAGYRVGCFTSPHLFDFSERITINDAPIPQYDVIEFTELLRTGPLTDLEKERDALGIEGHVCFFELTTAIAFLYFARQEVDIAVLEVGIGGRLDPTNTVNPLVSVLTNVGLDHQQFLGNTFGAIAREKAGIIRQNGLVVTGCQGAEALSVLQETCRQQQAALYRTRVGGDEDAPFAARSIPQKISPGGSISSYRGIHARYDDIHLPLVGTHQIANATVALATLELLETQGFHAEEPAIRSGLLHVMHPGRLEAVHTNPRVVVDIAHNALGASAIANALTSIFSYTKLIVIIGVLHDKDIQGIVRPFLEVADSMIFTSPHSTSRAEEAEATAHRAAELVKPARQYDHWQICHSVEEAIEQALSLAGAYDLICATGSNYTVSEAELYFDQTSYRIIHDH